jgi:hypothetical protein
MQHIARAAPLSPAQRADEAAEEDEERQTWGQRRLLSKAMKWKRRTMWQHPTVRR